jgi:hypothetical protein
MTSTFREIIEYIMRRLVEFEKLFSPAHVKVVHHYADATSYDEPPTVGTVHIYHYRFTEPTSCWDPLDLRSSFAKSSDFYFYK